jgi:hypothetical protein
MTVSWEPRQTTVETMAKRKETKFTLALVNLARHEDEQHNFRFDHTIHDTREQLS